MFIPIIPFRVKNLFICKSCNYEFNIKELDNESKTYYKQFKSKKSTPIWLFSGPIIAFIIFGFFTYNKVKNNNEMILRLQNGKQKQVIEYETEEGQFTTIRTLKVNNDSVWLNYNSFEIENYEYIDRITASENYISDTAIISLNNLIEMAEEGQIKSIYSN
jgi:hypothetical protein